MGNVVRGFAGRINQFSGFGTVSGTVKKVGTPNLPGKYRAVLHEQASALPVQVQWTEPSTGAYVFTNLNVGLKYYVVARDHTGQYAGECETDLVPEVTT